MVLVAAGFSGCAGGEISGQNPNQLAPKFMLQQRPDGNVTVFVHGAFRDLLYEWIAIRVNNATVVNRTWSFSTEQRVDATGFFLEVEAEAEDVLYRARARIDVNETDERVRVSVLDEEAGWDDPRPYGLPFTHVLDRPKVPP